MTVQLLLYVNVNEKETMPGDVDSSFISPIRTNALDIDCHEGKDI